LKRHRPKLQACHDMRRRTQTCASRRVRGVRFLAGAYLLIGISDTNMGHTQPRDY